MRRALLSAVSVVALLLSYPVHAWDIVECVNCSTLEEQALQYLKQLDQLIQETVTAEQEVLNSLSLPSTVYRDLTGEIQRITGILKQADLLVAIPRQ